MPHTANLLNRNRSGTKVTYKGKSGGTDTSTGPSAACTMARSRWSQASGAAGRHARLSASLATTCARRASTTATSSVALDVEENAALRGEYGVVTASVFDFLLDKDCLAGIEEASGGVGFVLSSTQASIIWVTPTMGATAWRAAESAREWTTRSSVDSNEISIVLTI